MIKINILTHFLFALNTIGCINNVDGNHKLSFNGYPFEQVRILSHFP